MARNAPNDNERDAAFQEIREWLYDRHNPPEAAARYRNQERNSIALHVLVAARPPFDLVEQIIRIAPNTVCELTNNDRTALHIAIECKASPEVVQLLVNTDSNTAKKAVQKPTEDGRLPLHIAIECQACQKNISILIEAYPQSVNIEDQTTNLLPVELALKNQPYDVIKNLFERLCLERLCSQEGSLLKCFCILQNMPDDVRRRLILENCIQTYLNKALSKRFQTSILLLDFCCTLAAIVCNGIAVPRYNAYIFGQSIGTHSDFITLSKILLSL